MTADRRKNIVLPKHAALCSERFTEDSFVEPSHIRDVSKRNKEGEREGEKEKERDRERVSVTFV